MGAYIYWWSVVDGVGWLWMVTRDLKISSRCSGLYSESHWLFWAFMCFRNIHKLWLLWKWVAFEWFGVSVYESSALWSGELKYLLCCYVNSIRMCRPAQKRKENRKETIDISICGIMALLFKIMFINIKGR